MLLHDRIMLRKRALIESVNDELKNMCQIEFTRHRCFDNFIINILSALAAYSFFDKKPSIHTIDDLVEKGQLVVASAFLGICFFLDLHIGHEFTGLTSSIWTK